MKLYNIMACLAIVLLTSSCNSNLRGKEDAAVVLIKECIEEYGVKSCITSAKMVSVYDSHGKKQDVTINGFQEVAYAIPVPGTGNKLLLQVKETSGNLMIIYDYKSNTISERFEIDNNIISHKFLSPDEILIALNNGKYYRLNFSDKSLEELFDYSEYPDLYGAYDLLESDGKNFYILSPELENRSIVKINIASEKILWEHNHDANFVNFILVDTNLFYLKSMDFSSGEIGILDATSGKTKFKYKCYPNVLVKPVQFGDNIYYSDSRGRINKISLHDHKIAEIYTSSDPSGFMGVGSSKFYKLEEYIYFIDNFKIYRMNLLNDEVTFVQNHTTLGFNFIYIDKSEKLQVI